MRRLSDVNGLKYLRVQKGHDLSQTELGKKLGVSMRQISRIENGDSEPSGALIIAIAEYFDVDPRTIFKLNKESE